MRGRLWMMIAIRTQEASRLMRCICMRLYPRTHANFELVGYLLIGWSGGAS